MRGRVVACAEFVDGDLEGRACDETGTVVGGDLDLVDLTWDEPQRLGDDNRDASSDVSEARRRSSSTLRDAIDTPHDVLADAAWQDVSDTLNRILRGWSNYFCHGTRRPAFRAVDHYVYERVRDFLARRHKVAGRGTRRFSFEVVYGELGLLRLERLP